MLPSWSLPLAGLISLACAAVFTNGLWRIITVARMGTPAPGRLRPVGPRLRRVVTEILNHENFQHRPWIRVAHWCVMISFPILAFTLVTAFFQLTDPGWAMPGLGSFAPWNWLVEFFAWAGLIGGIFLTAVRTSTGRSAGSRTTLESGDEFPATSRFFGSVHWQARYVEFTIIGVVACVLIIRGAEYAYLADSEPASWVQFPTTAWIGALLGGLSQDTLGWIITGSAIVKLALSLSWLVVIGLVPSMGVAWHRFLAIVNVYAQTNPDGRPALGPLPELYVDGRPLRMDTVEDLDEDATLGYGTVSDISWKGLLDTATCTECGRCQDLCPAWNSNKPLSPKLLVTTLRDHAFASAPFAKAAASMEDVHSGDVLGALLEAGALGDNPDRGPDAPLMPNVITPDVLWACTMCGACVDQCPVDIEQIDLVIGLRRHQVLMESAFPSELGKMFTGLENKGNPWGLNPRKRLDWAKNLDFDVPQVGVDMESAADVDYLFWVGCAGAYDDRAKKTSAAVAELLHTAGVSFAVLGDGESCTGDPARRAGNEVLFQMLAEQNIDTLNEVGATNIVVSCAHCFNTIAKEYPDLGGHYTVVHHTQLLNRLVRDGRLTPVAPSPEERKTITFHDPCFLGRHNNIYSPPRELLGDVREMELNRERAMCCGAGGAHAFFEDKNGTSISGMRTRQAVATGADVIATACPFCTTMLTDGARSENADIEVKDVSLLLLEGVKRGQRGQD
ncbi:(Fe-S)-binding protein [Flaviflexus equikiangi]|uniref:(Fe-S)-binding protein n=1 Tax=Flaviflexus equikiangi TaxID=2758573 RepID=UPI002174F33D|nr:(Fe-S)-binding protein [Flaviflexus equikiangi]